jgi:protoporphyrinogen oxidase
VASTSPSGPATVDAAADVVILGGGVTGLAAGSVLRDRAIVLEREARPGGLVRTEPIDGYWFDTVLHLLHLADGEVERRVRALMGATLVPCAPEAWVETAAGITRYPFQMHLAPLEREPVVRCLRDLAEATYRPHVDPPANFEEVLLRTFGRGLCELFLFPYNRKLWKRPLADLAPGGFTWNIAQPTFDAVLRGALDPDSPYRPYNANGWYPRPAADADWRGMETLSRALAGEVPDLRCRHEVVEIDAGARIVTALDGTRPVRLAWRRACASTLPLPTTVRLCPQAPAALRQACASLTRNRVLTVMVGVRGPRPEGTGKWRYYADETVIFNRLVFLHEFDPALAPAEGWGLLAEITEPAEWPLGDPKDLTARVLADLERVKILPAGSRIAVTAARVADPAYVVFTVHNQAIAQAAREFLTAHGIEPIGRYGRWEYSSIGQNLRDGFTWGEAQQPRTRGAGGGA